MYGLMVFISCVGLSVGYTPTEVSDFSLVFTGFCQSIWIFELSSSKSLHPLSILQQFYFWLFIIMRGLYSSETEVVTSNMKPTRMFGAG